MKGIPIFFNIENKNILVAGGGHAAEIKIKTLLDFEASIVVVAPKIKNEILQYAEEKRLIIQKECFTESHLQNIDIVIAAADEKTNSFIYKCAKEKGLLCSVSSANITGDFMFQSHKKAGDLIVSATTNGKFPLLSKKICESVDLVQYDLEKLEEKRKIILQTIQDKKERKKALYKILENKK